MGRDIGTGAMLECGGCGLQFDDPAQLRRHTTEDHGPAPGR